MHDQTLRFCLQQAPQHEESIRRLFRLSPFFADLMRDADEAECRSVFSDASSVRLPDPSSVWRPTPECEDMDACMAELRRVKREGMRRILWWELGLRSDVLVSAASLSSLAINLLEAALRMAERLMEAKHGRLDGGKFCVIGLGKLGGMELNLNSDVDLLFLWQTRPGGSTSTKLRDAGEYYQRLSRTLLRLMSAYTELGRAWITDMRLRPGGDGGPLCLSLDATLQYYQNYGQTWERAMLIKARPVAGDLDLGTTFINELTPFIYRRYLDYTTIQALADMKRRIDIEAGEKGIGKGYDIKRGKGGIREIEFLIQSLQLLFGGRHPELRVRASMSALQALLGAGLITPSEAEELEEAYRLWRSIEHALQARCGEQTHVLFEGFAPYLSEALGLPGIQALMQERAETVQRHFRYRFPEQDTPSGERLSWLEADEPEWDRRLLTETHEDRRRIKLALKEIRNDADRGLLPARSRNQINGIVDRAMQAWQGDANQVQALEALARLFRQISGRATWIDLLATHEGVLSWMLDALAASAYIRDHLVKDPTWLEWPIEGERGKERIEHIERQLEKVRGADLTDEECLADMARLVDQARITTAMAIAAGEADPLSVGDWLARTADQAVRTCLQLSLRQLRLPFDFPFVCLAMGKHGSREMGLVSDLDLVYLLVHEDPASMEQGDRSLREWSQRLGRRIIQHLTAHPPFGAGYQLDVRLRPSGQSGVLVTTLNAFRDYQLHHAQTWEHQALCRARAVAGPKDAISMTDQVVTEILDQPRDEKKLARDVMAMRQKMLRHLASHRRDIINLKQDEGGLVDIEFLAQYARLIFGGSATGTVAGLRQLHQRASRKWRESATELAQTYLDYRQMENILRVQLWQSISGLPRDETAPEWETLRRHGPIKSPLELEQRMNWVHERFLLLLNEDEEN